MTSSKRPKKRRLSSTTVELIELAAASGGAISAPDVVEMAREIMDRRKEEASIFLVLRSLPVAREAMTERPSPLDPGRVEFSADAGQTWHGSETCATIASIASWMIALASVSGSMSDDLDHRPHMTSHATSLDGAPFGLQISNTLLSDRLSALVMSTLARIPVGVSHQGVMIPRSQVPRLIDVLLLHALGRVDGPSLADVCRRAIADAARRELGSGRSDPGALAERATQAISETIAKMSAPRR